MATLIVLRDRKSHSFRIGGKEYAFKLNKGKYTSVKEVIDYVEAMPSGMFSVTHNVEPPRPKPAAQAEPLDKGVDAAPEPAAEKPTRRKRRKVAPDE